MLEEGIPFHFGFGDFTGADIAYNWERITSEESVAIDRNRWDDLFDSIDNFVVDGNKVTFNMVQVEPDFDQLIAVRDGNFLITSKAQWEAEGAEGMEAKPAGTGPFRFVDRQLGTHVLLERVENHWRQTPEFKEVLLQFVSESATRMAMALTGETHMTILPIELQNQVLVAGKGSVVTAPIYGSAAVIHWGGQYYCRPELLQENDPFTDIRVRMAMAMAINQEEIIDTIFEGRAIKAVAQKFVPIEQGWDPNFVALHDELYGYNPERAKELLAEAGYPDGFKTTIYDTGVTWSEFPALSQIIDAAQVMWQEIGIDAEILAIDMGTVFPDIRDFNFHGNMIALPVFNLGPPAHRTKIEHDCREGNAIVMFYGHPDVDNFYNTLERTVDREERQRLQAGAR